VATILTTIHAFTELGRIKSDQKLPENISVRVSLEGAGCGGFTYGLKFEEPEKFDEETDMVCDEGSGIRVITKKQLQPLLEGTLLGFDGVGERRGFTFQNPNEATFCAQCPHSCYANSAPKH